MVVKKPKSRPYPVFYRLLCQEFGCPVEEFKFHPTRKWRFDYAYPEHRVAIEVEGLVRGGKSRHTTISGYIGDCDKYNQAILHGWKVIRLVQTEILKTSTIELLREIIIKK
jgi:very-short-patch-repair endonuclease